MDPKECPHEKQEFLGEDKARNQYSRCTTCGAVLVHDGKTTWMIPAVPAEVERPD